MKNVNDEAPQFEPRNQLARVKKGANQGFLVYTVQAFDPDGDHIQFDTAQSQFRRLSVVVYALEIFLLTY